VPAGPLDVCAGQLGQLALAHTRIEQTEDILSDLEDQLHDAFKEMQEECGELEDWFDDIGDILATFFYGLSVVGTISEAIEIAQCTTALGEWERIDHEIDVFRERLEKEKADLAKAQDAFTECVHKALTVFE
jgi:uncharacterized protein (UPF0335 family)